MNVLRRTHRLTVVTMISAFKRTNSVYPAAKSTCSP